MTDTVNFGISSPLTEGNDPREMGYSPLSEGYQTNPLNEGVDPKEVGS